MVVEALAAANARSVWIRRSPRWPPLQLDATQPEW